jgi:hypothetical protein
VIISRRRAHGISKEGAPSVENEVAKCGRVGCHLSTLITSVQTKVKGRRVRHLLGVWAATSRVRHLSKRGAPLNTHVLISQKISSQLNANQPYLVSFDSFLTFVI